MNINNVSGAVMNINNVCEAVMNINKGIRSVTGSTALISFTSRQRAVRTAVYARSVLPHARSVPQRTRSVLPHACFGFCGRF